MVNSAKHARIAAIILSWTGAALAVCPLQASAQSWATRETPSAALARNMRLLADSPRSFEALVGAGKAALELGDTQAAVGFFGRADEVYPASPVPQIGMGAAAVSDGNAVEALAFFTRAQQLGANGAMMGKDRGLAFDLLGRHADAQADYRKAMVGADADEARRRLALSLAISGDQKGALEMLAPLMAKGDSAGARCRALVLALTGDPDGARRSIEAAMPGSSLQMAPFFARLPSLRSDQKAAAVNLGIFPDSGQPSYAYAPPPQPPAVRTTTYATTVNPVTGDRLASIEDLLRSPNEAVRQAPAPVQVANVVPIRRESVAAKPASEPVATSSRKRFWIQLASGKNSAALPEQFRRIKSRHKELLEGISGYVAEDSERARLLIGPFRSPSDAEILVEDLESVRVDAFSWTSAPGQTVRKLSTE